jgi:hypothetical protein
MDCKYKDVREDCLIRGVVIQKGEVICGRCYLRDNSPAEYNAIKRAKMMADAFFGTEEKVNEKKG